MAPPSGQEAEPSALLFGGCRGPMYAMSVTRSACYQFDDPLWVGNGPSLKGGRRFWRSLARRPLSDKAQVLLLHWSVAGEGVGRQRGHRSGMELLLWLPEFTSGLDVGARSWPFDQMQVMAICGNPRDILLRLSTHNASDVAELLPHRWALSATKLARRVHRCLQSEE